MDSINSMYSNKISIIYFITIVIVIFTLLNTLYIMETIAKFKASQSEFVRNIYRTFSDRHRLNEEELNEVLQYKNISKNFEYNDWYGSSTNVTATLINVEKNKWNDLIFTIKVNKSIPKHYVPSPSDILKGQNLLFPVSYSRI